MATNTSELIKGTAPSMQMFEAFLSRGAFLSRKEGRPEYSSHGRQLLWLVAFLMVIAGSPGAQCQSPTALRVEIRNVMTVYKRGPYRRKSLSQIMQRQLNYCSRLILCRENTQLYRVHFETPSPCHDTGRLVLFIPKPKHTTVYKCSLV